MIHGRMSRRADPEGKDISANEERSGWSTHYGIEELLKALRIAMQI
ncbi:MAG: hypothetical protein KAW61_09125 [candidate division Zixibacteria bacterium]|nr:hypothetical protein [candidate division Zixibacteria bacterium]